MKFLLNVRTSNDAFVPDPRPELVRILRDVAGRVEAGEEIHWFRTIHDANGNDVGRWALKPEDYEG
jgi:hypothetical protein